MAHPRFSVFDLDAPIRIGTGKQAIIGYVRRGTAVKVRGPVKGTGCKKGHWYRLTEGGAICTADGYRVTSRPQRYRGRQHAPNRSRPLPYRYGRVRRDRAPLLTAAPGAADARALRRALSGRGRWPRSVHHAMVGDYFLAIQGSLRKAGQRYYRTVQGFYARKEDLKPLPGSHLTGERLKGRSQLPLVFVHLTNVRRYRLEEHRVPPARGRKGARRRARLRRRLLPAGAWQHYARFTLDRRVSWHGHTYLVAHTGMAVRAEVARVARFVRRPRRVGRHERWIQVDLASQTLVAYEGDRPVYATVVSTGKRGHTTPGGLFRIHAKYVSTTMSGADEHSGRYRVEEVPWTMYYDASFALHGAYWHDRFGRVRSHGCTNLAPADARWLFRWSTPHVPKTWHARIGASGTWVLITPAAHKK